MRYQQLGIGIGSRSSDQRDLDKKWTMVLSREAVLEVCLGTGLKSVEVMVQDGPQRLQVS